MFPPAPTPEVTVPASPSPLVPAPVPVPSPAPKPPAPEPTANSTQWCVPLNFGEWLNKLLGKQTVCITLDWGKNSGFWPF